MTVLQNRTTTNVHFARLVSVRFQNIDLLKKCIAHDVDINASNPETGTTPLMLAAALGYQSICNLLIDAGADVNANDHSGNTPLHLATQGYGEKLAIVQTLMGAGADVHATNEDGFTAAMLAKRMENDACFTLLDQKSREVVDPPTYQEFEGVKEESVFPFT